MVTISIQKFGKFAISAVKIRETLKRVFLENGIVSDCEASVAIVNGQKMQEYVDEYYKDGREHPVLSFPTSEIEEPFTMPPDGVIHLGEIVVNFTWAVTEANKTGKMVEHIILELVEHGGLHLIGIHHD